MQEQESSIEVHGANACGQLIVLGHIASSGLCEYDDSRLCSLQEGCRDDLRFVFWSDLLGLR